MSNTQESRWQGSPVRTKLVHQVFAAAAARAEWAPLLPAIVGDLAEVMLCLTGGHSLSQSHHQPQSSRCDVGSKQRRSQASSTS